MKYEIFNIEKDYSHVYYFLKDRNISERFITSLRKKENSILINDKTSTTKTPLKKGDVLKIDLNAKEKSTFKANNLPLDIIFEDDFLLIVNKPANVCCSPSKSHYDQNLAGSILGYMQTKDPDFVLRMKNRLDKDTSGLIIAAKDVLCYNNITILEKKYHAVCTGEIKEDEVLDFKIETINKNGVNQLKRVVSENGKTAKTFVHPLKNLKNSTLVELVLENGRTHQIRVHLSHINHPLIGDEIYGTKSNLISHTALICKSIRFVHPITKQNIFIEIDYPDDFKQLIKILSI